MNVRAPGGFTLIEVVVGLAVASLIVLLARETLVTLGDAGRRIHVEGTRLDSIASGEHVMREVAALSHVVSADSAGFFGTSRAARFRSWCRSAGGWRERCSVVMEMTAAGSRMLVLEAPASSRRLVVRSGFRMASLIYLRSPAGGGDWRSDWADSRVAPHAIGVVVDGDTTIIPIGAGR